MRRPLLLALVPTLLLLAACDARRDYPPGYTDVDLWRGPSIRIDTEVPNQYPDGTTRGSHQLVPQGSGEDEGH